MNEEHNEILENLSKFIKSKSDFIAELSISCMIGIQYHCNYYVITSIIPEESNLYEYGMNTSHGFSKFSVRKVDGEICIDYFFNKEIK